MSGFNVRLPGSGPIEPEHLLRFVVSIEKAALILGIEQRQTRDLCKDGTLYARQLRREWAVSLPSVLEEKERRDAVKDARLKKRQRLIERRLALRRQRGL